MVKNQMVPQTSQRQAHRTVITRTCLADSADKNSFGKSCRQSWKQLILLHSQKAKHQQEKSQILSTSMLMKQTRKPKAL